MCRRLALKTTKPHH